MTQPPASCPSTGQGDAAKADRERAYDAAAGLLHAADGNVQFVVDARDQFIGRHLYVDGSCGLETLTEALAHLGHIETLIDVGANIGVTCIPAVARLMVDSAIAIEPHPWLARLLRANVALNGLERHLAVHETALWDRDGVAPFEFGAPNLGDSRITVMSSLNAYNESDRIRTVVLCARFDTLLPDIDLKHALLWLDVQGFEGAALAGAPRAIAQRPPLVAEFWPYGMERAGTYPALREALKAYRRFRVLGRRGDWRPMTDLDLLRESIPGLDAVDILVT